MLVRFLTNPTVTTCIVVGVYIAVAGIAWIRSNLASRVGNNAVERRMLVAALLFLVLGLSYQLEFLPRGIALAKSMAKEHGWYEHRWSLVVIGLVAFAVLATAVIASYRRKVRRLHWAYWSVGFGSILLVGYFLLRATSIHWIHAWSGIHFGCPQTNPWIEVISMCLIAMGFCFAPNPGSSAPRRSENLPVNIDRNETTAGNSDLKENSGVLNQIPAVTAAWRRKPRGLPRR